MKRCLIAFIIGFVWNSAFAQEGDEETQKLFSNESELSVSVASGNAESESYLLRQLTEYEKGKSKATFNALYQQIQGLDPVTEVFAESARRWELGFRFEREVMKNFAPYINHIVFSDVLASLVQRNSYGLGAKYTFWKKKNGKVSGEAGAQSVFENRLVSQNVNYLSSRARVDGEYKIAKNTTAKLWVEYILNVDNTDDYEVNFEPSIIVKINSLFSMKVSYQSRYDNVPASADAENLDTLFATSLIAKF